MIVIIMSLRVKKVLGKMYIFIQVRHVYVEQVTHYENNFFLFKRAEFTENEI